MLKFCVDKWNQNKDKLRKRIETDNTILNCEYIHLVKLVVEEIFNDGIARESDTFLFSDKVWDGDKITVIDNGDYQGTLLFAIPKACYQPGAYEYLMTYVGYGSCSGCDTLLAIQDGYWGEDWCNNGNNALPIKEQVDDFMALCLHIVENTVKPYNCGWREEDEFNEVEWKGET